jgi:hypothetical protein
VTTFASSIISATMLWALPTPRTIPFVGLDQELGHAVSNCESHKLSSSGFRIEVEMQKSWKVKVEILFLFRVTIT